MTSKKGRTARLVTNLQVGPDAHILTFEVVGDSDQGGSPTQGHSFQSRGGQYVIVDTGQLTSEGRPLKRAYSLLPGFGSKSLKHDASFSLAIHPLASTLDSSRESRGSHIFCEATSGQEFKFSGPWGRLAPDAMLDGESPCQIEKTTPLGPALVIGAGTGITGAAGIFTSGRMAKAHPYMRLLWLDTGHFLTPEWLHEVISGACGDLGWAQDKLFDECRRTQRQHSHWLRLPAGSLGLVKLEQQEPQFMAALISSLKGLTVDLPGFSVTSEPAVAALSQPLSVYYLGDGAFYQPALGALKQILSEKPEGREVLKTLVIKKEFYYHRPQEPQDGGSI